MNRLSTAAAVLLAASSGVAQAGGIQINLATPGSVGGSYYATNVPGGDFSSAPPFGVGLLNDAFAGTGGPSGVDKDLLIQGISGPLSVSGVNGYLTYQMHMSVSVSGDTTAVLVGNDTLDAAADAGGMVTGSEFYLYFTPYDLVTAARIVNGTAYGYRTFNDGTRSFDVPGGLGDVGGTTSQQQVLLASGGVRTEVGTGQFELRRKPAQPTPGCSP
jgi:hypothetical protein